MAFNPSKTEEALNSPVQRASQLNDPQFENQQGYFPYDLTHQEFITPLFGQITPTLCLDTVPGDRTVVRDNTKLILNQINGNFLSTVNQYIDSFYVSLRNVFPTNYEKLIPNPTKGSDLPNTALPVVPLLAYFYKFYRSDVPFTLIDFDSDDETEETEDGPADVEFILNDVITDILNGSDISDLEGPVEQYVLARITLLATILSRGQLLDYLGFQLDVPQNSNLSLVAGTTSLLQQRIDEFFDALYSTVNDYMVSNDSMNIAAVSLGDNLTTDAISGYDTKYYGYEGDNLSQFRGVLSDIFESGRLPLLKISDSTELTQSIRNLVRLWDTMFGEYDEQGESWQNKIERINARPDMDHPSYINIGKVLAYQLIVAQYFTNDHVDNIFNSDLYMQNLRSVMYPTEENSILSAEPTFMYNGVSTEYDYISWAGFWTSLCSDVVADGSDNRSWIFATLMFLLRRSLRYGDYFSTARPNMLAVSDQLSVNVSDGAVSPIDITRNLLLQRYLNAVNFSGSQYLSYMNSIFGIKPSDTGVIPRFVSHRKIVLQSQITNNTGVEQGKQTTNLVGYSDMNAFDVFIDDFGYLISLTSFDVLPVYGSGIDSSFYFADRFDYFNPMLQAIGDQPIRSSELLGFPELHDDSFGYTMRNGEYKYKISKAHGAFVNSLPGFMLRYPLKAYMSYDDPNGLNISPDFIRDKPQVFDSIIPQMTGISPATYYHFIISVTNEVKSARKIQATPGVLF